ncbi:FecR family protein [Mucilaginibacter sp. SMC90]|uniref:FecR family protein n=1 Tax=Mucilaginibacter sp. SMC90 TaxID=2929803 RepID=UPI001FB4DFA0|nr:FecR family protein [Mucilaginibacter sp. SMC90]UOE52053.1 FecR family protein [Mucilaginibacter sp. SMC90]
MNNYDSHFNLGQLIAKYMRNELTDQEKLQLDEWIQADIRNQELFKKLTDETLLNNELETFSATNKAQAWNKVRKSTGFKSKSGKPRWIVYAAAIILLAALTITLNKRRTAEQPKNMANLHNDIPPGTNKATLTLADGSIIVLDSTKHGQIARQQNIVIKEDENGKVVYEPANASEASESPATPAPAETIAMNILATPRGGQYQVVLPDGTKVWLNAASSLKYPATFTGSERRVELTGEAYFEVAKDPSKPFNVKTASQTVTVLGTHFNINSYTDEGTTKTTLLEGSVRVTNNAGQSVKIIPGEQAINTLSYINVNANANVDEAIAWKNGKFMFNNTDLQTIMRQLSRWYEVDVEYHGKAAQKHYMGRISRNVPVSQIFEILKTSGLNFTINGRKIIVKS